jgi:hypothetical protein
MIATAIPPPALKTRRYAAGFALAMLACGTRAEAVPPLVSGDVPTAEQGEIELYLGVLYEKNGGAIARKLPSIELNYGIFDGLEMSFQFPWLSEGGIHGGGDFVLGPKYVFLTETKTRPGIAGSFELKVPTASSSRGLGTGAFDEDLLLRVQKSWSWFTLIGNVGYTFLGKPESGEPRRDGVWFVSLVQGYQVTKKTTLFTEFYVESSDEPGGRSRVAANLGFDQELWKDFALQGSIGRSLREAPAGGPDLRMYVGIHWTFGAPWQRRDQQEKEQPQRGALRR